MLHVHVKSLLFLVLSSAKINPQHICLGERRTQSRSISICQSSLLFCNMTHILLRKENQTLTIETPVAFC